MNKTVKCKYCDTTFVPINHWVNYCDRHVEAAMKDLAKQIMKQDHFILEQLGR